MKSLIGLLLTSWWNETNALCKLNMSLLLKQQLSSCDISTNEFIGISSNMKVLLVMNVKPNIFVAGEKSAYVQVFFCFYWIFVVFLMNSTSVHRHMSSAYRGRFCSSSSVRLHRTSLCADEIRRGRGCLTSDDIQFILIQGTTVSIWQWTICTMQKRIKRTQDLLKMFTSSFRSQDFFASVFLPGQKCDISR